MSSQSLQDPEWVRTVVRQELDRALGRLQQIMDRTVTAPDPAPFFTPRTLAAYLSVSVRTIRRMEVSGKIPLGHRISGVVRWPAEDILRWKAAGSPRQGRPGSRD